MKTIVRTKIVPPRRRVGLLRRPRLLDFLHENISRKLLLISAGPGYGKTSLLVDFQQDTELTTTWYSMDASDADPWRFVAHLVASIGEAFPAWRETFEPLIPPDPSVGGATPAVLRQLVNEVQSKIPEYFVILIDDFQYSDSSPAVVELVTWLLDHMPDNCSLILASRSMPNLPYLKLAARQEIAGLGSQDLAFTAQEIREYLALNHNLDLPIDEARRVFAESEGWITGILLGTQVLWKGLLQSLAGAKGNDEFVFDYLAQEVFAGQPEPTRRFLRATSILGELRPGFCDALLGIDQSEALLEKLESDNLFVTRLSGEGRVYRCHSLFQEFLRRQFAPDQQDEKRSLHRAAAGLLEQEGDSEAALDHYLAAQDQDEATRLLKVIMEPAFQAGRQTSVTHWLEALGESVVDSDPSLLVMLGRLHQQKGEFDQALARFQRARRLYREVHDPEGEAHSRIREALIYRYRGDMAAARAMCTEVLGESTVLEAGLATRAMAHRILGETSFFAGELPAAKGELRQSLRLYEQAGDQYEVASLLQALGNTARGMGNPLEAEGHYARALRILRRIGNRWRAAEVLNNIGVGHYYQGEYEKALVTLEEALTEARATGHLRTESLVLASLGDVHAELGNSRRAHEMYQESLEGFRTVKDMVLEVYVLCALASLYRVDQAWEQAHAWLGEAGQVPIPSGPGYLRGLIAFHRGAVSLDQAKPERAAADLAAAVASFEAAGAKRELARAQLWNARAFYETGNPEKAMTALGVAVDLCAETANPHLLVFDGRRMIPLLEEAHRRGGERREEFDRLLTRIHQLNLSTLRTPGEESPREIPRPQVEVCALGEATVRIGGLPISHTTWGGPLVKELFFYLVERGPVRRETILAAFWPEHSLAKAKGVFHATLYRMRRVLPKGLIGYRGEEETYFVERPADTWYDVSAFEELILRSSSEGMKDEGLLREAMAIYRGPYLGDVYSDWAGRKRDELQRKFVEGMLALAGISLEKGALREAVELYRRCLAEEPYREDVHRALMHALTAGGRHAEAIQHFQRVVEVLHKDLAIDPSEETEQLYQSILKKAEVSP
jgi:ATP/maltotriose-dependent transcriptional regulator MalT/DNA-binding SARP family transcriptional activator